MTAKFEYSHCVPGLRASAVAPRARHRSCSRSCAYGFCGSAIATPAGNEGKPEVWVVRCFKRIAASPNRGTVTPLGA